MFSLKMVISLGLVVENTPQKHSQIHVCVQYACISLCRFDFCYMFCQPHGQQGKQGGATSQARGAISQKKGGNQPSKSGDHLRSVMTGHGPPLLAMDDQGLPWPAMADHPALQARSSALARSSTQCRPEIGPKSAQGRPKGGPRSARGPQTPSRSMAWDIK